MTNLLLAAAAPDWQMMFIIACAVLGALALIFIVAFVVAVRKIKDKNRRLKGDTVEEVKVIDGVRYTRDDRTVISGEANITHKKGDIILSTNKTYTAKKGGRLMPGKYTVLSADGNADVMNIRIGGFVRECKHMSSIVLNEGDEITAVSHTVVLR